MPSFNFSLNFSGTVRIEPTDITLDTAPIIPELVVPIHIKVDHMAHSTLDRCVMLNVFGVVLGGSPNAKLVVAEPQPSPMTLHQGHENQISLRFPINERAAAKLEHDRKGDIVLGFIIRPTLASCEMVAVPNSAGGSRTHDFVTGRIEAPQAKFSLTVPQSHWINRILSGLRITEYLLLELPTTGTQMAPAWTHIRQAESSYFNHNSKGVFAHCRQAGVALDSMLKAQLGASSFAYAERWGRAYKHFSHLASLDLHLEEIKANPKYGEDTVATGKPDLEYVLFLAKGLARFAELLDAHHAPRVPGPER